MVLIEPFKHAAEQYHKNSYTLQWTFLAIWGTSSNKQTNTQNGNYYSVNKIYSKDILISSTLNNTNCRKLIDCFWLLPCYMCKYTYKRRILTGDIFNGKNCRAQAKNCQLSDVQVVFHNYMYEGISVIVWYVQQTMPRFAHILL